jgi:hypothetical protein
MRAAGNAADVTDEMMAMADDVTMFNKTPLPMDALSRELRGEDLGFMSRPETYHGTSADIQAMQGGRRSDFAGDNSFPVGVYSAQRPDIAATYADPNFGGQIYPLATRDSPGGGSVRVDGGRTDWNKIPNDATLTLPDGTTMRASDRYPDAFSKNFPDTGEGVVGRTNSIAREASRDGAGGVMFDGINDIGQFKDHMRSIEDYGPHDVQTDFYPQNIRSRFARFDPEFAHLSNLSAGVAGLGVVGLGATQGQQTDDPYAQRNTLAEVMRPAFGNALNGYTPPLPRNALQRGF